jgi:hypothetical protein
MALRECPYCGKLVFDQLTQCSHCRETLPEKRLPSNAGVSSAGGHRIRRGLLFMLIAATLSYFARGMSPWTIPVPVPSLVTNLLLPLLFFSGLGLALYGIYLRFSPSN